MKKILLAVLAAVISAGVPSVAEAKIPMPGKRVETANKASVAGEWERTKDKAAESAYEAAVAKVGHKKFKIFTIYTKPGEGKEDGKFKAVLSIGWD